MKKLALILAVLMLCGLFAGCNPYVDYITAEDLGITEETQSSPKPFQAKSYCSRKLITIDWTVEIYESLYENAGNTLFYNRYALSDGTNVYRCRLEGAAENSVLFHTAFACGGTMHLYDSSRDAWTSVPIQSGDYPALLAYVELENGESFFIIQPKSFRHLENDVLEYLPEADGCFSITGNDGYWDFSARSGDAEGDTLTDCLCQVSPAALMDIETQNIATCWATYANGKEALWCYDGYYRRTPKEYTPHGENMFYRCAASYLPRTLTEIPAVLASDISILIPMMDAIVSTQNEDGYWATTPECNWLLQDYGIGAGFYDTRFNSDLLAILVKMDTFFGKGLFDEAIDRYVAFFDEMASSNHTETANGGWLVEDYWCSSEHSPTHTSLNHQASECLLLYNLTKHYLATDNNVSNDSIEFRKAYRAKVLGNNLFQAILDTCDEWIKDDNDFYYSRMQDGTFIEGDYPHLTYNDLYQLQEYLIETNGSRNEKLEQMLRAKRSWMDQNGYTNYMQ